MRIMGPLAICVGIAVTLLVSVAVGLASANASASAPISASAPVAALASMHDQPTTPPSPTTLAGTATATNTPSVPTATSTPAPIYCGPNWVGVPSPNVGMHDNELYKVSAVSSDDVWAVGAYVGTTRDQTLTEHWDGSEWSVVSSPSPGSGDFIFLNGVSAVSSNDVWAVGNYDNTTEDPMVTLIEHWNGNQWSVVPSPNLGIYDNDLIGVSAVSSNDVWAVGDYVGKLNGTSYPYQTLIEHWNGSQWSVVTSPNSGIYDNHLVEVAAASSGDVWAVGRYYSQPNSSGSKTLIEHWDGSTWSVVTSPNSGIYDNELFSIAAISNGDVWAVGDYQLNSSGFKPRTLIEHWNGSQWSIVPSPSVSTYEDYLQGVAAVSSSDVWAVGYYYTGHIYETLVEHWDGTMWSVVPSPNSGTHDNDLFGAAALPGGDVWAVGRIEYQTLTERYNPCPSPTPTPPGQPTATSCPIQFSDVPVGSTFYPFIRCLACRDIVNGYSDGTFKASNYVTRGQLSKIVSNSAGFIDPQTTQMFQDVPVGSVFQVFIGRLVSRGYISGYPCGGSGEPCLPPNNYPYFRPSNNATRGQLSKIVANTARFADPPWRRSFRTSG